jgi:hypothetical protein
MASTSDSTGISRGEEMTKGMMQIVELMLKARDREALIDKAVDRTVEIAGRFDGKNVTKFLATYRNEMQQRDVQDQTQIASFKRVVEPQVRERIIEIQNAQLTWAEFEKALLTEYMLDDASRMTRHALISWIEKKGKNLSVSGVYAEYDRMYDRLPGTDQRLLDGDKVLLFLKAVDAKDRRELGSLLEDEKQPNGLVTDWATVKRACNRLDKRRQWLEDADAESPQPQSSKKVLTTGEPSKPNNEINKKAMEESIIEELSKRFETVSLANMNRRTQKGKETSRCVWCDSSEHLRRDCAELREAIRKNVVYLDGFMICSNETRKPLRVNFGRGGMKKIVEEEDARHVDAMHYAATAGIRVGRENLKPIESRAGFWPTVFECEKKGKIEAEDLELAGRNVKRVTGWTDPVDDITSVAEVVCDNYEALVDEKRKKTADENVASKRPNTRDGRRNEQNQPATQREVGESSGNPSGTTQTVRMEANDSAKKGKERASPTYRLKSDIEQATDLRKVLEEKILDSHVDLTLRELLGIAKREFHDTIVDLIKRKRQQSDEEEARTNTITMAKANEESGGGEKVVGSHFSRPHWARATTETPVKVGDGKESVVALIDHGSEINLMSTEFYKQGRWPINTNHGWKVRAATKATEDLYGACPNVKVTIGDVEIDQHFFVQDSASHEVILGQPYITSSRMETKVFDNGAAFARVRSVDGRRSVQFLTVRPNHERNRVSLGGDPSDF